MKKIITTLLLIFLFPLSVFAYSDEVILGGDNIGININTKGIMVIGYYKVNNSYLNKNSIRIGDYITKINSENISNIEDFTKLINKYINNGLLDVTISRNNKEFDVTLKFIEKDGVFKSGLFVKDSLTGIGTITYIDPNTGVYGALGHEISDASTLEKVEISGGKIFDSEVTSINRSTNGNPGSKNANILYNKELGTISINEISGIYGKYKSDIVGQKYKVANINEIKMGEAYIYTVLENKTVEKYKIKILKVYKDKLNTAKSISFIVNDKKLLTKTGGIIQGMSGSPIIQGDKIIGAVTNVVVDKVNRGYGIYIKTMLETGDKILNTEGN